MHIMSLITPHPEQSGEVRPCREPWAWDMAEKEVGFDVPVNEGCDGQSENEEWDGRCGDGG